MVCPHVCYSLLILPLSTRGTSPAGSEHEGLGEAYLVPEPSPWPHSGKLLFDPCPFPSPHPPQKPRRTFPLFGFFSAWLCPW